MASFLDRFVLKNMPILAKLQNVANDFRPDIPPRVATIIQLRKSVSGQWWKLIGVAVVLIFVIVCAALLLQKRTEENLIQDVPVLRSEKSVSHKKSKQKPKVVKVEEPQDIVLPASSLQPSEFDAVPVPNSDPTIAVVSEKITDAPAALASQKAAEVAFETAATRSNESLLEDAHLLLEAGDDQGALSLYDQVLASDKQNRPALAGKVFVAQRSNQYEVAVDAARQLLRLDPRDSTARTNFITVLGKSPKPSAMAELQRMVDARPNDARARVALSQLLLRRGYFEQAHSEIGRAIQIEPDNLYYKLHLAILYDRAEQGERALPLYQQVLRSYAQDGRPLPSSLTPVRQRVDYLRAAVAANANPQ